jgi:hypothetical protein
MLPKYYLCRITIMRPSGFSDMHGQVSRAMSVARAEQFFSRAGEYEKCYLPANA